MRFAFMAGLPRSGSTLLAALLNQRSDVHVTRLSDAADVLRYAALGMTETEQYRAGETSQRNALLRNTLSALYSDLDVELVVDKHRMWGTPFYRRLLEESLGEPPLILAPVRPLEEIVASFVRMAESSPSNYIDRMMLEEDFYSYWRKPINDARTDWLLLPNGHLGGAMLSLHGAYQEETRKNYHLIGYDSLCSNTEEVLSEIEKFLDLRPYHYTLDGIIGQDHNDLEVYGIPEMHHVRERIKRTDPDPGTVLSSYALERCRLEDFWT